jgi:hypothetical protein
LRYRVGVLYLVSYIDRGNLGNAYTAGMGKAWGITSADYSWVVMIYYISYLSFQPLILVRKYVPLSVRFYIYPTINNNRATC